MIATQYCKRLFLLWMANFCWTKLKEIHFKFADLTGNEETEASGSKSDERKDEHTDKGTPSKPFHLTNASRGVSTKFGGGGVGRGLGGGLIRQGTCLVITEIVLHAIVLPLHLSKSQTEGRECILLKFFIAECKYPFSEDCRNETCPILSFDSTLPIQQMLSTAGETVLQERHVSLCIVFSSAVVLPFIADCQDYLQAPNDEQNAEALPKNVPSVAVKPSRRTDSNGTFWSSINTYMCVWFCEHFIHDCIFFSQPQQTVLRKRIL